MTSTYSPSLRIELIETGTALEAWGTPTDNNLGTIIEQAIVGSNTISLTNLTTYTLTTANAAVDQARNAVLVFNGALTANCNVIAPSVQKVYVVSNQTTGGKFVNIKTATGNAVQVINGTNQLIYCNGTDFISAVNVNTVIGNLSVSGNSTVSGNVTIGSNIVMGNTITNTSGNLVLQSTTSNLINFQNTTGALIPPYGTNAQRPSSPVVGMSRWNIDLGWYEIWNGTIWQQITGSVNANYLIVAGGGGGGNNRGGGGGAGGLLYGSVALSPATNYSIVVGSGGAGGVDLVSDSTNGANSFAFSYTAIGGGRGGQDSGGSGGAPNGTNSSVIPPTSGTSGQGNASGSNSPDTGNTGAGGGGGGAGAVGGNGSGPDGGSGGAGLAYSITGSSVYYAGGGGGGNSIGGGGGSGGNGGGGKANTNTNGSAGTNGLGGGGGGGSSTSGSRNGGNGGSGVVIIRYASSTQRATGGTVTSYTSGGNTYWVHTFTTSGTLAVT